MKSALYCCLVLLNVGAGCADGSVATLEPDAGGAGGDAAQPVGACSPEWRVEEAGTGAVAPSGAVAVLDPSSGAHVVYTDVVRDDDVVLGGALVHAYQDDAGIWVAAAIDGPRVVGLRTALARDGASGLHVMYSKGYTVEYGYREAGGGWMTTEVDSFDEDAEPWAKWVHLAVDARDVVHAVYSNGTAARGVLGMKYATFTRGGYWEGEVIAPLAQAVSASIALDAAGGVHIAYRVSEPAGVYYTYRTAAGAWEIEAVPGISASEHPAIVVDGAGGVHVAAGALAGGYAYRAPGGVWRTAGFGQEAERTSLAVDAAGAAHVAYIAPCEACGVSETGGERMALYHGREVSPGAFEHELVWSSERATTALAATSMSVGEGGLQIVLSDPQSGTLVYASRCVD